MSSLVYMLAAVFLPLFPLSMLFNRLFMRVRNVWLRMAMLLLWPQAGVLLLALSDDAPPVWLVYWGALTALLYAFRALALKDLGLWTAYMATSSWSLLWLATQDAGNLAALVIQAIGLSLSFALLAWLVDRLERQFGAAYAGASWGLAHTLPRLSVIVALSILATIGTPLFPAFFVLLYAIVHALPVLPGAVVAVTGVWLLWTWSGARMLQGLVVGPACDDPKPDLGAWLTGLLAALMLISIVAATSLAGAGI